MRTQTVNLVVISDGNTDHSDLAQLVTHLPDFTPSRVVILTSQMGGRRRSRSASMSRSGRTNRRTLRPGSRLSPCADAASGSPVSRLPLLVPELPDFVWCTTPEFAQDPVLDELSEQVDRIMVDSSASPNPATALNYLVHLAKAGGPELKISDMAWTSAPFVATNGGAVLRQPVDISCLYETEEVVIECAKRDGTGQSGITGGLLTAAWLAYCMEWRAPGEELVRSRDGWKLTLRAGPERPKPRGRDPDQGSRRRGLGRRLLRDPIDERNKRRGTFLVRRTGTGYDDHVSEMPHAGISERTIYSANPDQADLLSRELREFDSDPVFEQSLQIAANMWPAEAAVA